MFGQSERTNRVSDTIARRIKKQISDGRLTVGHKLPAERDMARQFKTSRVSVREAYRSLEELGLLRIRRGAEGGAFIAQFDHEPVRRSLSLVLGLGQDLAQRSHRGPHDPRAHHRAAGRPPGAPGGHRQTRAGLDPGRGRGAASGSRLQHHRRAVSSRDRRLHAERPAGRAHECARGPDRRDGVGARRRGSGRGIGARTASTIGRSSRLSARTTATRPAH